MSHELNSTELLILKALWATSPLSAREVHEACEAKTGWQLSTTRTFIRRMVEKELLEPQKVHGVTVYLPVVQKVETLAGLARHFFSQVLEHKGPLPVAAFSDSALLSPDEVEALSEWLDKTGETTE